MSEKLNTSDIQKHLAEVPNWSQQGDEITCKVTLPSFAAAIMFAGAVGQLAEAADHHPDILIQWKHVTLTLSTHSANGLTAKDFELAKQIDAIPHKS